MSETSSLFKEDAPLAEWAAHPLLQDNLRYGFQIQRFALLVGEGVVSEVVKPEIIYPVPHAPPYWPGLINLRGTIVPVFDLQAALLHFTEADEAATATTARAFAAPKPASKQRVLVFDRGEAAAGLLIDDFPRALPVGKPLMAPPQLPPLLAEAARRVYAVAEHHWIDLDHRRLFRALTAQLGQ